MNFQKLNQLHSQKKLLTDILNARMTAIIGSANGEVSKRAVQGFEEKAVKNADEAGNKTI